MYENKMIKRRGLATKHVVNLPDTTPKRDAKSFIRSEIESSVFDLEDSVADNAKMISLLLTMVDRLWSVVDTASLPDADIQLIEYSLGKFKATTTTADLAISKDPIGTIDTILNRQGAIADIVK